LKGGRLFLRVAINFLWGEGGSAMKMSEVKAGLFLPACLQSLLVSPLPHRYHGSQRPSLMSDSNLSGFPMWLPRNAPGPWLPFQPLHCEGRHCWTSQWIDYPACIL
ncbi:mCG145192, partial [Mus musculus]